MALGWDTAVAQAASEANIPFTAAVPFFGQECRWSISDQQEFHRLLKLAKEVVYVSPGLYSPAKMQARNVWMVDRAKQMLAMWDGSSGGTANAIAYARAQGKPIVNLYNVWKGLG